MTDRLWPRLSDITYSQELLSQTNYELQVLSDAAYRTALKLVALCASGLVWTYTAPTDGSLPDDDERLARAVGLSPTRWQDVRKEVAPFFEISGGRWHLARPWVIIDTRPTRAALPLETQRRVLEREGKVCTYCGCAEGPFDFDHIYPLSRGGSDDPSNLTLACASCNRSKGSKTLREWLL